MFIERLVAIGVLSPLVAARLAAIGVGAVEGEGAAFETFAAGIKGVGAEGLTGVADLAGLAAA